MKKLPQNAKILIGDHRITHVETSDIKIRFFSKHASVYKTTSPHRNVLYFEVEKKLYLNSNHSSKISFPTPYGLWTPEGIDYTKTAAETEKKKKQVEDFINKLMSGVTLVPRFSLKQYTESPSIEHPPTEVNE